MILDGKLVAAVKREKITEEVAELKNKTGKTPSLVAILVGEDPASKVYVKSKEKACEKVGIISKVDKLPDTLLENELLDLIDKYNKDPEVNGILVQLPLPPNIDEQKVIEKINPIKDVDCFHPYNVGKLSLGTPVFYPATPAGVIEILKHYKIETSGKNVVVVGRSNIVGKPIASMMVQKTEFGNSTVTIAHSRTKNLNEVTKQADILIAAIGRPEFVKADMVKPGAVVIDVGVNRVDDETRERGYRLAGDVDFKEVEKIASAITPVPGGVGPMTITMLLQNTLKAFEVQNMTNLSYQ
ncbi:MAG: bifunctional methylenetetrahydrofolate dehydrogenase/methenyltetrahydrofolate cyclohydrolase FolD [Calditrichia bacterium]|nr:bifunctional methylenetetrahydrofolate dehydrogenase/methenyltetrahydrofolate cyclohydrolase FolD [Calditrichia bacterium]